jgi:hypothetical protein
MPVQHAVPVVKGLGRLPDVADTPNPQGSVPVAPYNGPGSWLCGAASVTPARMTNQAAYPNVPAPSPALTASSDKPERTN